MSSPGRPRSWIHHFHPVLQGLVAGSVAGGIVLTIVFFVFDLADGRRAPEPIWHQMLSYAMIFFTFLQIVLIALLPGALAGAVIYRKSARLPRSVPYLIVIPVVLLVQFGLGLLDSKFFPPPAEAPQYFLLASVLILSAAAFWLVAMRAREEGGRGRAFTASPPGSPLAEPSSVDSHRGPE